MAVHLFSRRDRTQPSLLFGRAALAVVLGIFAGTNSHAQGLDELGVPADLACASILKEYLTGIEGLNGPCDEGHYEVIMAPATQCPRVVKQRAQKAHTLCLGIKATERDYDDCNQTTDVDRALAGCTRIINDKTQSVTDRAFAHVQRGNVQVLKTFFADAISNYNRALKLDPRNVLAYAARAIANWKDAEEKHEFNPDLAYNTRLDAMADYRKAREVDAVKTDEMIAASPDLQKISLAASKTAPNAPRRRVRLFE
jgi:hypothetical protein